MLVSLHNRLTGSGPRTVLKSRDATTTAGENPVFVLEGFGENLDVMAEQLIQHESTSQDWVIQGVAPPPEASDWDMCSSLHTLMQHGAHYGGPRSGGIVLQGVARVCAEAFARSGYTHVEEDRWSLTESGLRTMSTCSRLVSPTPVFQVREHIALEDMAGFELTQCLQSQG